MGDQWADIEWRDGRVPISRRFDDPYFSLENGLDEARHVFLAGNDLPARFRHGFHVAELGFGTGLNFGATLSAWRDSKSAGVFRFTTFEAYPLAHAATITALESFPDVAELITPVVEAIAAGKTKVSGPDYAFEVIIGDANLTLPEWDGVADAWYLDGFAPAKNPELWTPPLMEDVAGHTAPGGTAATYTAAGAVRRALSAAGFDVERRTGFGRKRHMTVARRAP